MRSKLSSWKVKVLSFAGIVTLVKSVLIFIASYHMHNMKFPKHI